jgi:hypothetical protein
LSDSVRYLLEETKFIYSLKTDFELLIMERHVDK